MAHFRDHHFNQTTAKRRFYDSAPRGIRIPVLALRGLRPGPLDDGGKRWQDSIMPDRACQRQLWFIKFYLFVFNLVNVKIACHHGIRKNRLGFGQHVPLAVAA